MYKLVQNAYRIVRNLARRDIAWNQTFAYVIQDIALRMTRTTKRRACRCARMVASTARASNLTYVAATRITGWIRMDSLVVPSATRNANVTTDIATNRMSARAVPVTKKPETTPPRPRASLFVIARAQTVIVRRLTFVNAWMVTRWASLIASPACLNATKSVFSAHA